MPSWHPGWHDDPRDHRREETYERPDAESLEEMLSRISDEIQLLYERAGVLKAAR